MQEDNNPYGGGTSPQPNTPYNGQPVYPWQQSADSAPQQMNPTQQNTNPTQAQQPANFADSQQSQRMPWQQPINSVLQQSDSALQRSSEPESQQQNANPAQVPQSADSEASQQSSGSAWQQVDSASEQSHGSSAQQPTNPARSQQSEAPSWQQSGTAPQNLQGSWQQPVNSAPQQAAGIPTPQPAGSVYQQPMDMSSQPPTAPVSAPPMGTSSQPPMGMSPQQPFGPAPQRPRMAIVSLILGIVAIVLFWIPIVGIACGIAAIVTGFMSMRKINAGRLPGKGLSIGGLATGIIAAVLSVIVFIASFNTIMGAFSGNGGTPSFSDSSAISASPRGDDKQKKEQQDYKNPEEKVLKGSGSFTDTEVKIASAKRGPKDHEGAWTLVVTYQYKNTGKEKTSFLKAVDDRVSQNGITLVKDYLPDNTEGYSFDSYDADVAPNASSKVTVAYKLIDGSTPVNVVLQSGINFKERTYVTQTINIK
ncbi:DUF5067 domain-containing protein [Bifidobacterium sp. ESL0769]|uniref:DUF5067 domain-containing protein n=1 Tax=Bifidobacterium sp. ESL0769 TaxID=2983229 RepID=UPI0023F963C4|nr:DUF5067 domain-containing protein [Bifidobacterium sp. ESL0769]WEV67337.1 DUF5067 domain-containing protein [Bifidobacterium sp. ESL0769]